MSTSCIDNSNSQLINTNLKNKTRNSKTTSSNSNLFARALNYAFKKTPKGSTNADSTFINGTWKAKLGKYLSSNNQSNYNNNNNKSGKSLKNSLDGCNLDMDDEFNGTYHLSRQIHKKNQLDLQSNSSNKITNNHNNPSVVNHSNSNQLFLCLSSSSSSSASNNSTSLSTPASFEAQNNLLKGNNKIKDYLFWVK